MAFNKTYIAKKNQTVFDVCLQLTGDVENVFEFIAQNPAIENLDSDINQLEVLYEINNTFVQKFYINQQTLIANKPKVYRNTDLGALIYDINSYIIQDNGYKILV